jgi:S1-C subfamily serine protease
VPTRADRPYGAFPRGRPDAVAGPAPAPAPARDRLGAVRRGLPWFAALAVPLVAIAVALTPVPRPDEVRPTPTPTPPISAVYEKVAPSVVGIRTTKPDGITSDAGSGVIIDDAGDVLTSLHVIEGARNVVVVFADGTQSMATVIATMPENDIAALRPQTLPSQLVPATLGNPASLRIGDDAIVVGNPYQLTRSLSTGVISGLNRSVQVPAKDRQLSGLIQFDAAVNPGSSGGPLVNRDGEVVGIVTGLVSANGQPFFSGIGFAVTIDTAAGALGLPPD